MALGLLGCENNRYVAEDCSRDYNTIVAAQGDISKIKDDYDNLAKKYPSLIEADTNGVSEKLKNLAQGEVPSCETSAKDVQSKKDEIVNRLEEIKKSVEEVKTKALDIEKESVKQLLASMGGNVARVDSVTTLEEAQTLKTEVTKEKQAKEAQEKAKKEAEAKAAQEKAQKLKTRNSSVKKNSGYSNTKKTLNKKKSTNTKKPTSTTSTKSPKPDPAETNENPDVYGSSSCSEYGDACGAGTGGYGVYEEGICDNC